MSSAIEKQPEAGSDRQPKAGLFRYRTIDLVTLATIGVGFGVIFWAWGKLYGVVNLATVLGFPPAGGLFLGGWLIAGVVGGLIIRKPGAAFGAEMIAAAVSMFVFGGTEWGFSVMVAGLVQGIGAELAFALPAYRRFSIWVAVLSGMLAAVAAVVYEWNFYYADWSLGYKFTLLGFGVLSGVVIAGVLGWLLTNALARSGVLDAFAAGREAHDTGVR